MNKISANKTVFQPIILYSGKAINFYTEDASPNTKCTRDFQCALLSFKSDYLNRTTISKKELHCRLFPGSYQQDLGGTIKKVSNRIIQALKLEQYTTVSMDLCFVERASYYIVRP
jgi:hypothetical protein